ncbi:Hypothetical predicted protein [Pelobates cultripes]|uniref:Uncharacterized protein n=1 Tax=Pelobates cultripes TaxID=61616 RepID=A0AAD1SJF6_PELCU|nr:Hypothetical predicted protein [Pelobates cultripes]
MGERNRRWRGERGKSLGITPPKPLTRKQPSPSGLQAIGSRAQRQRPHGQRKKHRKRPETTSSSVTPTSGGNLGPNGSQGCGEKMQASMPAWGWKDTLNDTRTVSELL